MTHLRNSLAHALPAALLLAASSCVDDNYDLSDIDTSVRVNVNDLSVPLNVDEVQMTSILKESDILKIVDGQYTIVKDGSFTSPEIRIDAVNLGSTSIGSSSVSIPLQALPGAASGSDLSAQISTAPQNFSFSAQSVPGEIVSISNLGLSLGIRFEFNFTGLSNVAVRAQFQQMVLQLPKGLLLSNTAGGDYNSETGELILPTKEMIGEKLAIELEAYNVNFQELGATYNRAQHTLAAAGEVYVKNAKIVVAAADIKAGASPTPLTLTVACSMPPCTVTSFSGEVDYKVNNVNINPISLSGLPDVLTQPGTNLSIANPAIFLSVENPLQAYNLMAQTGFAINAHHGSQTTAYPINDPTFNILTGVPYVLSPSVPAHYPAGYENAVPVGFTSLSQVLSGNGLPTSLSVDLNGLAVLTLPTQTVNALPLGQGLGRVTGNYLFNAPVELLQGSTLSYTGISDGWDLGDGELTLTKLEVNAAITTNLPMGVELQAYPLDKQGHRITTAQVSPVSIQANASAQQVTLSITGTINGIDGIEYHAVATAAAGQPLSPNMNIKLQNIKVKVSGYYEDKL